MGFYKYTTINNPLSTSKKSSLFRSPTLKSDQNINATSKMSEKKKKKTTITHLVRNIEEEESQIYCNYNI